MEAGFRVGQFVLEKFLGEGGMAEVWLGRNPHIGTTAAIKFLNQQFALSREVEERFLNEGRRQGSLDHPNIVKVYGFEYVGSQGFLILQYIDGDPLDFRLQRGRMGDDEMLRVSRGVLSALSCAHTAGIVHRDIKPSNILLGRRGEPYLGDFGIVRAMGESSRTRTTARIGTPNYMSPEQITRPKEVDHRADIYSFGIVLYEMLTGRVPFDTGADPNSSDFLVELAHVQTPPPPPRSLNPAIRPAVEQVVLKCLAKEPAQRYFTCEELSDALARAMVEPALQKRPPVRTVIENLPHRGVPAGTPASVPVTTIEPEPLRRSRMLQWIILAAAIIIASGSGVAYYQKLHPGASEKATPPDQPQIASPSVTGLDIRCDVKCVRYVDGVLRSAGTVQIAPGTHEARVVMAGDPSVFAGPVEITVPSGQTIAHDFKLLPVLQAQQAKREAAERDRQIVQSGIVQAKEQYRNKEYSAALDTLDRVLKLSPDNQDAKDQKDLVLRVCTPLLLCGSR